MNLSVRYVANLLYACPNRAGRARSRSIPKRRAILEGLRLGEVCYLTPGEINAPQHGRPALRGFDRTWEYLCRRAGVSP